MRVVHITTVPGTLLFLTGHIRFTKERGGEVVAIASQGEHLERFGTTEGIQTQPVEMTRRITPVRDVAAVARLVRILRTSKPDIVHAHTPKGGLIGMIAAFIARSPVRIYHLHGMPYTSASGRRRWLLQAIERVSCALADRVFCVSPSLRDQAIADGICRDDKIVVFGRGSVGGVDSSWRFNPERFSVEDRHLLRSQLGIGRHASVIGFVGRIVRDKGVNELAAAWRHLRECYLDAHLVLVGAIETQDPVEPEILEILSEDPRVHLTGRVEDTSQYYSAMDLLVLPTYREGFGNVNLEAASMGIPVVSTNVPGCVDSVADGITGTLVPPRNVDDLKYAIERYLDDPDLRREHGLAGRERVLSMFRQEDIWEATFEEYARLLRERGIEPPLPREEASTT